MSSPPTAPFWQRFTPAKTAKRSPTSGSQSTLVDAVVAIEDRRFWGHSGVDFRAILRAALRDIEAGAAVEGGSTITQQYVKNALLASDRTIERKIQEASLAIQLEREHSKEEILEFYLNTVYFGNGAYGIQAAAQEFFGTDAEELTIGEGALLAGLIKSPRAYDPYLDAEAAVGRRNFVIDEVLDIGWLTEEQAAAAKAENITLVAQDPENRYEAAYFIEEVKQFILDDEQFGVTREERTALLFTGGLQIETTLDPELQRQAEDAVALVLQDPSRDPEAAVVTIEPRTGFVRALIGGHDFWDGGPQSKFNLATQGYRPAGSSFKPLVLAAALEEGFSLNGVYSAPPHLEIPITGDVWEIDNYGGSGGGDVSLFDATVFSYNTVFAQLITDVGAADAMTTAARLGINSSLLPVPSAVLGANDVSPFDMATAYATFANRGVRNRPALVTRVLDRDGNVLYEHLAAPTQAISTNVADSITEVLQAVVNRGTGVKARIERPVAGKTGTGQEWGDAWFVGYTPELATAVWVGFAEGQISMVPPTTRITVTGGTWPAEIWHLYMNAALADRPSTSFATTDSGERTLVTVAPTNEETPLEGEPVSDVVGMPEALAAEVLTRAGFVVVTISVSDDQFPPGYAIGTEPPIGTIAEGGSEVTILVADGSPVSRVPDVLGLTELQARGSLERLGYDADVRVEAEANPIDAETRAGRVWRVSPPAFEPLKPGESVQITVNP